MTTSAATPGPESDKVPASDNAPRIKRINKACLNCRKRKSRCLLEIENGAAQLPCVRCKRENLSCVLGDSNRGGRRVRKSTLSDGHSIVDGSPAPSALDLRYSDRAVFGGLGTTGTYGTAQSPGYGRSETTAGLADGILRQGMVEDSSSSRDEIPFPTLQNPSDALGILAQVAETSNGDADSMQLPRAAHSLPTAVPTAQNNPDEVSNSYALLDEGHLSVTQVTQLIQRYHQYYHPYFPLAPPETFDLARVTETARTEPHLLTAILVIASRDLLDDSHVYRACSAYMQKLVSNLAAGGAGDVEAVEALLLLAEWTPYTQSNQSGKVGRGEEDREAWMHVGVALRIGYFLGLDRTSFRVVDEAKDRQSDRRRLVWTQCYISDRQISIRIGKAFWSRGPGPLTTRQREDYPSLLPHHPNDEDYASIFQATLELTQLYSNVHDVLYSNPGSSFRSHLSGGYIKFIDDFRSAIYGWKSVWGTLTCSPHLKATLLMSYDFLRLYTNAFAFQATIRRALPAKDDQNANSANHQAPSRVFYNNVASVGDARFIYEGLDAAKSLLTTANNFVDPEKSLRFMPLRFYLYLVYSGVFLYRARCVGVMSPEEERGIRAMIQETVLRLQRSSVGTQHLGSRYSQLLKLLWQKVDHKSGKPRAPHPSRHFDAARDITAPVVPPPLSQMGSVTIEDSPAVTEQMGDFSWADLTAVSDFAMNTNSGMHNNEDALWTGFLPMDMGGGWDAQFDVGELGMAF